MPKHADRDASYNGQPRRINNINEINIALLILEELSNNSLKTFVMKSHVTRG
jgi:hypothetical protein